MISRKRKGTFVNVRLSKARCGYVQSVPRHPASGQRAALEPYQLGQIFDEDQEEGARSRMVDQLRRNDVVHITHLHLYAKRVARTNHNMRLDLWQALRDLEDHGGSIVETSTGRTTADRKQRDDMIRDAIEILTRGHKARASTIARKNGMKGGRPPKVLTAEQKEAARAAWINPKLAGAKLRQVVRRCGYSIARCYSEFGPRGGVMK